MANWFFLDAGSGWENLYGVCFPVIYQTGWAVGNYGLILKTTNGGSSWSSQTSGTNNALHGVFFLSNQTGYAVGDMKTILKTTNGGTNWIAQLSNGTVYFMSVHFPLDAQTGYAVGFDEFLDASETFKTTDGGANWNSINSPGSLPQCVYFPMGVDTGYIAEAAGGSGHVYKTTNGGSNWSVILTDNKYNLRSLYYPYNPNLDVQQGTFTVVGDNDRIYKTTNWGQSWQDQSPNSNGDCLMGVSFPQGDPSNGFIIGYTSSGGTCGLKTTNGGSDWYSMTFQSGGTGLMGLWMVDNNTGYAVGNSKGSPSVHTIMKTTNGGESFFAAGVEDKEAKLSRRGDALVGFVPNPFVDQTVLNYQLAKSSPVQLSVYNSAGQLIKVLESGQMVSSGSHQSVWDGKDMRGAVAGSGVYFVCFEARGTRLTKQVIKIK
jgi:photosystem II stability/assembly factor-like uncharacterized protein